MLRLKKLLYVGKPVVVLVTAQLQSKGTEGSKPAA